MTNDVTVSVEEHPELDNPLGKAQGAVQAAETILAEATEQAARLAGKLEREQAALAMIEEQVLNAEHEVDVCKATLEAAKAAHVAVEGSE